MPNANNILVPLHGRLGEGFSRTEKYESLVHPGRRTDPNKGYQSAIAWIQDIVALKQLIVLCSFCSIKFPFHQLHYRKMFVPDYTHTTSGFITNGTCDVCKKETELYGGGTAYVHEEGYDKICRDPSVVRRERRAAAKAVPIWTYITKNQRR